MGVIRQLLRAVVPVAMFCVSWGWGTARASLLDAYVLAIEHFDPNHEVGLEVDSAEVRFMNQALDMAREAIPEVVGIHIPTDRAGGKKFSPHMFTTLELVDPEELPNSRTLTPETVAAIAERIGEDCRVEISTYESRVSKSNPRVTKSTLWTFDNYCQDREEIENCGNLEIVGWLCSRGVSKVLLSQNSYKGRDHAKLYFRFNQIVDLEFKAKQLMADPLYREIFGCYVVQPYLGTMYGVSKSVEVLGQPGRTGFDGVVLKFNVGWGDCPSGCISWHHWTFKYLAMGEKKGERWPLVGGLVEEGGQPLDEHTRGRLRCAEPIR